MQFPKPYPLQIIKGIREIELIGQLVNELRTQTRLNMDTENNNPKASLNEPANQPANDSIDALTEALLKYKGKF